MNHAPRGVLVLAALLAAGLLTSCETTASRQKSRAQAVAGLPPLSGKSWLLPLESTEAQVSLPLGARTPRPIIVALHGEGDRPEWACGSYRHVSSSRGFVLCPAGPPRPEGRFGLGSSEETQAELKRGLQALKAHYGKHVAAGPVVLAAIGASVERAVEIALQEPKFFAYLVLVDGPPHALSTPILTRLGQAGGRRILWACSHPGCKSELEPRFRTNAPGGIEIRWLHVETHGLDVGMVQALAREFPWLVGGDRRFDTPPAR